MSVCARGASTTKRCVNSLLRSLFFPDGWTADVLRGKKFTIAPAHEKIWRARKRRRWRQNDRSGIRGHQRFSLRASDPRPNETVDSRTMARALVGGTIWPHQCSSAERVLLECDSQCPTLT